MKTVRDHLIKLEQEFEELYEKINRIKKTYKKESLTIRKGKYYYHVYKKNNKKVIDYIPKSNIELAKDLAQQSYKRKLEKYVSEILPLIRKINKIYDDYKVDEFFDDLSEERKKLVTPIEPTWNQIVEKWSKQKYPTNTYKSNTMIYTKKGDIVKSKSERLIADILYEKNIPYRYEVQLRFENGLTMYPDFMMITRDKRKLYLEHFGRMDDPEYVNDTIDKMNKYNEQGFIVGKNIIYTFESNNNPLNQSMIYSIVEEYLI